MRESDLLDSRGRRDCLGWRVIEHVAEGVGEGEEEGRGSRQWRRGGGVGVRRGGEKLCADSDYIDVDVQLHN